MPTRVSRVAPAALVITLAGLMAGCGKDEATPTKAVEIEITFQDGKVTPNGKRVDVAVDQPIDLTVTADEPGELHIHSDPEQTLPYEKGEETFEIAVSRPGVVEVESHELELVIAQLEVK